jgi:hypothetical protein
MQWCHWRQGTRRSQADQFFGDFWDTLDVRAKRTLLDDDVLTVDPAKLSHPVPE